MEKRIWNQPELELQVFAADEYVAVCDNKSWSAKGCVGNVPEGSSDFAWFTNNKTAKSYVDDGYFTYAEFQKTVEDDVWICANVTVLAGVRIGAGSVISAGSLVTKDIPSNSLAMGIPCKVVKKLIF